MSARLLVPLALNCTLLFSAVAHAEEFICDGRFVPPVVDNLRVPDGERCWIYETRVKGSIIVGTDAWLEASRVWVVGNVQAERARSVIIFGRWPDLSSVGGSVQLKQGERADISFVTIKGDLQVESNRGALRLVGNEVGGNLQAFQNRGDLVIGDNRIDGNLQCKENSPPPRGRGNRAASKGDQCRAM